MPLKGKQYHEEEYKLPIEGINMDVDSLAKEFLAMGE